MKTLGMLLFCIMIFLTGFAVGSISDSWRAIQFINEMEADHEQEVKSLYGDIANIKVTHIKEIDIIKNRYELALVENSDNLFDYILKTNASIKRADWRMTIPEIGEFVASVYRYSEKYGVHPRAVFAVSRNESGFSPRAEGTSGERGQMQPMKKTFLEYNPNKADFYRPEKTLEVGIRHLSYLMRKHDGNLRAAAAEYNAGCRPEKAGKYPDKVMVTYEAIGKFFPEEKGGI